ncbi:NAD(P)/FAD-dependent oxidoreductase [Lachnospiraceae bacterium 66-29]
MNKVIVIGSGISGMTCACALANKKYDVTVFEKHYVYGGYCQSFTRKGFKFGAAVHRVGGIYGKENINCILRAVGVEQLPDWYSFKEKVQVGDISISMCNSNIAEQLENMYPKEKDHIQKFWEVVQKLDKLLNIIDKGANSGIEKFSVQDLEMLKKYRKISVDEFLDLFFDHKEIKGILIAVSDAMPGGSVFAFIRMIAFANCGEDTYQPVGGACKIIEVLAKRIEDLGGKICLQTPVEKIIIQDGKAVGIISKGKKYYADYVVSNCDMAFTLYNLIGVKYLNPRLIQKVETKFTESPSCFSVWLGLDKDVKSLGYEPINISFYPDKNSVLEDKTKLIAPDSMQSDNDFLLISLSANNDPHSCPEGKGQMMLGMLVNWGFEKLVELRKNGNMEEYKKRKVRVAEKLIKKAERFYPDLRKHVEFMEIASPSTFERYTGNAKGAFGGYKCTPELVENYSIIDGKQLVGNLYTTGHWGGVGDGVIFTTDVAMRIADKIIRRDGRTDLYDFNKNHEDEVKTG